MLRYGVIIDYRLQECFFHSNTVWNLSSPTRSPLKGTGLPHIPSEAVQVLTTELGSPGPWASLWVHLSGELCWDLGGSRLFPERSCSRIHQSLFHYCPAPKFLLCKSANRMKETGVGGDGGNYCRTGTHVPCKITVEQELMSVLLFILVMSVAFEVPLLWEKPQI